MNRNVVKIAPFTYGLLGWDMRNQTPDNLDENSKLIKELRAAKEEMDPMDRIKMMYQIE